ncbi:conserved Plasmodium protein, unknown function [Plasmodium vivax]|uniref:Uncharacterized protein n=6 Tax=Plasmodium vivax TaxID=5855 RepID=A5K4Z3_PLAVS|nr:hypothetical protein, conserved [Plasmodium vivax]KMZ80298.1 hypothetical protein PVIIG_03202 [Plasmodium vivax India VII]KMZ86685.1 hypothetical protein PVBG_05021 [Plasmodium vivax Brazil I]KMZ93135.1 hypothetical protein PVMG_04285 [Plasmodium vivax Mauritania I]KMZ99595.1 hypothetical protein PVNG_02322 [Plasmodium vivax North Korean]EDL45721.1 hypothetical protein, conserved [Plasmodium vivax]|eukprot:XP_001615448.1 hypothetical protein [Plasmodium vivax Sal-1]
MPANYDGIRKLFNYYIREYYYQKSKGTYFVHIKKPGILFTSLKFYKKKKTLFPNVYDWYFDNLSHMKKNKDILKCQNGYSTKNIYSYRLSRGEREQNDVESGSIYTNNSEEDLQCTYRTSNLYYNMHPVYLAKICLYDLNDHHILFSNNYYDAFMQFFYSVVSYKMDVNDLQIFPNLKILISHIKNVSNIINEEVVKSAFVYFIRQKKILDEEYLRGVLGSIYATMLHNCPLYLFLDDVNQFKVVLRLVGAAGEIQNLFESALPYPYYLVLDQSVNIYNLQSFNIYLKKILEAKLKAPFSGDSAGGISPSPQVGLFPNARSVDSHSDNSSNGGRPHGSSHLNEDAAQGKPFAKSEEEKSQQVANMQGKPIYFFKLIKIFDMKPNYRFVQKGAKW